MNKMFRVGAGSLLAVGLSLSFSAQAFLGGLQQSLQGLNAGQSGGAPSGNLFGGLLGGQQPQQGANAVSQTNDWIKTSCRGVLGPEYEVKPLSASDEELLRRYFNVTPDFDRILYMGIDQMHEGAFINLTNRLIDDLQSNYAKKLAYSFKENPSQSMLAQIIYQSEHADNYEEQDDFGSSKPSDRTEVKTLLGLILLQYQDHLLNPRAGVEMLNANYQKSKTAATMMARVHLFGYRDLYPQNLKAFSGYIGQGSGTKTADATIVWALQNLPSWENAQMYSGLMQQSAEMQASLARQQQAASGSDLNRQFQELLARAEEVNLLTADAMGASEKIADARAKAALVQKEATGEANQIEVAVKQNEEVNKILRDVLSGNVQMDAESQKKFEDANRLRAELHHEATRLKGLLAVSFFASGGLGEVMNTGPLVNQYFRDSCRTVTASVKYADEIGVPTPSQSKLALQDEL